MSLSSGSINMILKSGGGMVVDAKNWSSGSLSAFVSSAKKGGAMLIIKNYNSLSSGSMEAISKSAKGQVIFM